MRRSFVRTAAVVSAAVFVLAACGSETTSSPAGETGSSTTTSSSEPEPLGGTLVVSNWDLYMPKSVVKGFEKETGVTVEYAIHTTNEDIMGKLTASNGTGFDLVFMSGPFVQDSVGLGWAATLDHSLIPNLSSLAPEASELPYDPGNVNSVPYTWGTTGICYRSDLIDAPTSWTIFNDPPAELDGKMTMLGTDRWLLQPALLSLGYSINTTDPAQIEEAKQWTLEAKEHLLAFDDTTFYAKLVDGQASAVQAWDGWCEYGRAEDPNIDFLIPSEGSDLWTDAMVVMESSENKAAAHAFIDYILRPEIGKEIVEFTYYKSPNTAAMEAVDPAIVEQFPTLAIPPSELLAQEGQTALGAEGTLLWTETATEIKAG
ncbi:MAG TPA: spermidine/putrescine ABC transporter substrate-binding protein [Actinomycetota bacterium]